nr:MAG TPA: hypothetical protein [Caudoviricetes sp.]
MIPAPKQSTPPRIKRLSLKGWSKGYMSSFDDGRMPNNALVRMSNAKLEQDGTVTPRPGLVNYGDELPGSILGFAEFVTYTGSNVSTELIAMVKEGDGKGYIYVGKDGKGWQKITGEHASFNGDVRPNFLQVNYRIVITNGVDYTSYYDIKERKIIQPQEIRNVEEVSATQTGLEGKNATYFYVVTAIKDGETARSIAASVQVSKERSEWRGNSTDTGKEYVTLRWKRSPGATKYVIYAGINKGNEQMMTVVSDHGGSDQYQEYVDSGKAVTNANNIPPNANSTRGIRAARASLVGGRVYLVGDTDDPYRITAGGQTIEDRFDFSAFSGFYIRINAGGKDIPVRIESFHTGRGEAVPMILFSGTNSGGGLKYLQNSTVDAGGTPITWMQVVDDNSRDGTDAPDAVVTYQNDLYYMNRNGVTKTGTMPDLQNVLSNQLMSTSINPDIELLNNNTFHKIRGVEFRGTIYWAVPLGSPELNQIWLFDLLHGGVWVLPWLVGEINDIGVYGDSAGESRLLIAQGNRLKAFSKTQIHSDETVPFTTDIGSGILKFSRDGAEWVNAVNITFVLLRPVGVISFSVTGKTEDEPSQTLLAFNKDFTPKQLFAGWSSGDGWSSGLGWDYAPEEGDSSSGEVRVTVTKDVDEDVNWLSYTITSQTPGTKWELSDVIIEYVTIGTNFEEDD